MARIARGQLVYRNEKRLFPYMLGISIVFWLLLVVGTLGIALVYALLIALFILFAQAAFISYLKGTGVRIAPDQFPDLHARLLRCCERVGLKDVPETYLLRTDFFNALATRFLGRHFVVLFTDVVDALEDQQGAIDFYIGHELGHIHRNHLKWHWLLLPASVLPVLGTAFRRAEEYTCDNYGAACCETDEDVLAALAAIAAGDTRWKAINPEPYLLQTRQTGKFWMSFNELTSDYPWLTKRTARVLALRTGRKIRFPKRHKFAWFLSCFVPRFGGGSIMSLMLTVMIIGILAAVAFPAYQDYMKKATMMGVLQEAAPIRERVDQFAVREQKWPADLQALGYDTKTIRIMGGLYEVQVYDNGVLGADVGAGANGERSYLVLTPTYSDGAVIWSCSGQNLPIRFLPEECKQ